MTSKRVTLRDVAEEAGVSHSTVSRVLNGDSRFSDFVVQQVQDAAARAGYTPRPRRKRDSAQSRQPQWLVYVVNMHSMLEMQHTGRYQLQALYGVFEGLAQHPELQCLLVHGLQVNDAPSLEAKAELFEGGDAIILMGQPERALVEALAQRYTVVTVDHDHTDLGVDAVLHDDIKGGRQAARLLLDRGFDRIGMLTGPAHIWAWADRMAGARLELYDAGLALAHADHRRAESNTLEGFDQVIDNWLAAGDWPPALITPTSMATRVIYAALQRRGLRCPQDLSLVAFDQHEPSELVGPKPTRLETHPRQLGAVALHRIAGQLAQQRPADAVPEKTVLPMRLVEGDSVFNAATTGETTAAPTGF